MNFIILSLSVAFLVVDAFQYEAQYDAAAPSDASLQFQRRGPPKTNDDDELFGVKELFDPDVPLSEKEKIDKEIDEYLKKSLLTDAGKREFINFVFQTRVVMSLNYTKRLTGLSETELENLMRVNNHIVQGCQTPHFIDRDFKKIHLKKKELAKNYSCDADDYQIWKPLKKENARRYLVANHSQTLDKFFNKTVPSIQELHSFMLSRNKSKNKAIEFTFKIAYSMRHPTIRRSLREHAKMVLYMRYAEIFAPVQNNLKSWLNSDF